MHNYFQHVWYISNTYYMMTWSWKIMKNRGTWLKKSCVHLIQLYLEPCKCCTSYSNKKIALFWIRCTQMLQKTVRFSAQDEIIVKCSFGPRILSKSNYVLLLSKMTLAIKILFFYHSIHSFQISTYCILSKICNFNIVMMDRRMEWSSETVDRVITGWKTRDCR